MSTVVVVLSILPEMVLFYFERVEFPEVEFFFLLFPVIRVFFYGLQ